MAHFTEHLYFFCSPFFGFKKKSQNTFVNTSLREKKGDNWGVQVLVVTMGAKVYPEERWFSTIKLTLAR